MIMHVLHERPHFIFFFNTTAAPLFGRSTAAPSFDRSTAAPQHSSTYLLNLNLNLNLLKHGVL
jgi:hypothetical protein